MSLRHLSDTARNAALLPLLVMAVVLVLVVYHSRMTVQSTLEAHERLIKDYASLNKKYETERKRGESLRGLVHTAETKYVLLVRDLERKGVYQDK